MSEISSHDLPLLYVTSDYHGAFQAFLEAYNLHFWQFHGAFVNRLYRTAVRLADPRCKTKDNMPPWEREIVQQLQDREVEFVRWETYIDGMQQFLAELDEEGRKPALKGQVFFKEGDHYDHVRGQRRLVGLLRGERAERCARRRERDALTRAAKKQNKRARRAQEAGALALEALQARGRKDSAAFEMQGVKDAVEQVTGELVEKEESREGSEAKAMQFDLVIR